ncbi:DM13 domain-containing protein [Streptomyces sp. HNM0663]|uniref:DM13 domain-containing protein n=1 Tax=Streptomyces chengmaiensis TaxID=3040919 RepID=A0ABT6HND4_9ACTN|nr:DM13 domain-containing protein [Streptomyces chengmaiensis]MDH2390232.1 DM13 domain-containing protein [Streptomyces chengmaiensis]
MAVGRVLRWFGKPLGVTVLVVGLALAGAGLYWFQPWKLWVDETVRDEIPTAAPAGGANEAAEGAEPSDGAAPTAPAGPVTLAEGELISHEHTTTGSVKILRLADGSRTLRLENLDTSNGPDLRVLLSDAPVKEGKAGWHVFDDGAYVSLGKLKGNKGDQNYALPADVDLDKFTSVSIWCDRFDVSFGAAPIVGA